VGRQTCVCLSTQFNSAATDGRQHWLRYQQVKYFYLTTAATTTTTITATTTTFSLYLAEFGTLVECDKYYQ